MSGIIGVQMGHSDWLQQWSTKKVPVGVKLLKYQSSLMLLGCEDPFSSDKDLLRACIH
jgi:hypothetical protein